MKPRIIFDTSAFNHIVNKDKYDPLIKEIFSGFEVIITGTLFGEVMATPDERTRNEFILKLNEFLRYGYCIRPFDEIITLLIEEHQRNPNMFNSDKVDIKAENYRNSILHENLSSDNEISQNEREFQNKTNDDFEKVWKELKPELDDIFENEPSLKCPQDYHGIIEIDKSEKGYLYKIGQLFYNNFRAIKHTGATEDGVKIFLNKCAPFRALCYSISMARFNWSLAPGRVFGDKLQRAGRNDLLSAVYMPYCDFFISDDIAQLDNLGKIAKEANIQCHVISLGKFYEKICLIPAPLFAG